MMKRLLANWYISAIALFAISTWAAYAQVLPQPGPPVPIACAYNTSPVTLTSGQAGWLQCTSTGALQVNASTTVTGFAPGAAYATLTATGSSADVALPAGVVVLFQNTGTTAVSCILSVGAGTATASKNIVQPSSWMAFTVGSNTHGSCIDQTGSASNVVVLTGGSGLATGSGGGGGSGGGATTIADGADVAEGATADAAATAGSTGTVSAKLRLMTTQLDTINSSIQGPIAGVSQAQTGAAASSLVAKASAGSVISISGSAVSGSYIMLFNATSAPSNGAVTPVKCWGPMAAAGPFSFGWGPGPILTMATGITVVSSSTGCFTQTLTNAAFISVEYQ